MSLSTSICDHQDFSFPTHSPGPSAPQQLMLFRLQDSFLYLPSKHKVFICKSICSCASKLRWHKSCSQAGFLHYDCLPCSAISLSKHQSYSCLFIPWQSFVKLASPFSAQYLTAFLFSKRKWKRCNSPCLLSNLPPQLCTTLLLLRMQKFSPGLFKTPSWFLFLYKIATKNSEREEWNKTGPWSIVET